MVGGFGMTELLVILAIVLLIFGPKRIKSIGSDLGNAIKGFRKRYPMTSKAKPADTQQKLSGQKATRSQNLDQERGA